MRDDVDSDKRKEAGNRFKAGESARLKSGSYRETKTSKLFMR